MKTLMIAVVALLIGGLVGVAQAKKPADGKGKTGKPVRGQIVSVAADGTNVVVMTSGKKATEITVTTDDKTKVTIDGTDAKLADLKKDLWVQITPGTGLATDIKATTAKPEKTPKKV